MINSLRKLNSAQIILIVALLLGVILRVAAVQQPDAKYSIKTSKDSQMYVALAKNLMSGKGYVGKDHMIARKGQPTAFYGPTYPFFLVALFTIFGKSLKAVQVANLLLTLATGGLVYLLGKRLYGPLQGAFATLIVVLSPQIIHYGIKLMSESIYIFMEMALVILLVVVLQKERPSWWMLALSGLLLGVTYLCRQTIFVLPALFVPIMWLRYAKNNGFAWLLKSIAVFGAAALLVITPWVVRNYITFGEVITGTTTGPATLWWGTVEDKGTPLSKLEVRYRNEHPQMNEIQMSHEMSKEAKYNLLHMTTKDIITKIGQRPRRLFGFPGDFKIGDPQLGVGLGYALLGLFGTIGLFMMARGRYDRMLIALFTVSAMGLHLATHAVFRYLMPEVPFLALGLTNIVAYTITSSQKERRPQQYDVLHDREICAAHRLTMPMQGEYLATQETRTQEAESRS